MNREYAHRTQARAVRPRKQRRPDARGPLHQEASLLTAAEEVELAARIKQGDSTARDRLIMANLRLVMSIANGYRGADCPGLEHDDLVQEGNLGLMRAAQDFDPETHDARFATYASYWIHHHIQRALAEQGSVVKFPYYLVLLRRRHEKARERILERRIADRAASGSIEPTLEEVAEEMGVEMKRLKYLHNAQIELRSCSPATPEDDASQDESLAIDMPPERPLEVAETMQRLHAAIRKLSLLESWVVRRRYRLDETIEEFLAEAEGRRRSDSGNGPPGRRTNALDPAGRRTFCELAREIGRPRCQVRAAEASALAKLLQMIDPEGIETALDRVEPTARGSIIKKRRTA
ncbi:sigma-70 family RNA polymerase sigma factor [Paludisphaera rhizosphaerae]|uniref:sigma-70 family RNA polymerase sigma factor n=1 Tax=Paludisphaera rhizosphaerae TaxID=2711216 RepID=UPI0013ED74C5|nr:sigma-70 family RNA polymerase sigma factor [Paludisphaera rhizosphaerae]